MLGCAGLLPFLGALLATAGLVQMPVEPQQMFVFYSAVILSFLCGSVWGRLLGVEFTFRVGFFLIFSNLVCLTAWLSLLSYSWRLESSLGLLILGYILILACECIVVELLYKEVYRGYLSLRCWLSLGVITLHLGMLIIS